MRKSRSGWNASRYPLLGKVLFSLIRNISPGVRNHHCCIRIIVIFTPATAAGVRTFFYQQDCVKPRIFTASCSRLGLSRLIMLTWGCNVLQPRQQLHSYTVLKSNIFFFVLICGSCLLLIVFVYDIHWGYSLLVSWITGIGVVGTGSPKNMQSGWLYFL